ncbi:hypothetical protein B0T14DRAFT_561619 [Immersiella caudata]|uniref:Rhodopsin domain-containing protein n=1 Tax=Immersiella caudata TaxID=314043 RepID=A0AA40CD62_9PEZI|nr:hypothetical protein B0T14DRAFT_561619 [Immersiella caudata]
MSSTTGTAPAPPVESGTDDPLSKYFPGLVIDHSQDHASYQANLIACSVITWAAAAVFVATRYYTRQLLLRVWSWEDWIIVLSLLLSTLCSASITIQAALGVGRHIWTVPPQNATPLAMAGWFTLLFYFLSLWATKLSILMLYRRMLVYSWVKVSTTVLFTITIFFGLWTIITVFTACVPLTAFWDRSVKGICHENRWYATTSAMHISTEFFIYILPMPAIRTLRLRFRLRILLFSLFGFGFLLCVISILRMVNLVMNSNAVDFTWDFATPTSWAIIEVNFSIICACVMTLKPLIVKIFPGLAEARLSSSDRDQSWDMQNHPPTIGTKPMRTPLRIEDESVGGGFRSDDGDLGGDRSAAGDLRRRNSHGVDPG